MNEHFQWVKGPMTANVSIDKIALHHYVLKSEEVRRSRSPTLKRSAASWCSQQTMQSADYAVGRSCTRRLVCCYSSEL